jgi:hypothetical protein
MGKRFKALTQLRFRTPAAGRAKGARPHFDVAPGVEFILDDADMAELNVAALLRNRQIVAVEDWTPEHEEKAAKRGKAYEKAMKREGEEAGDGA